MGAARSVTKDWIGKVPTRVHWKIALRCGTPPPRKWHLTAAYGAEAAPSHIGRGRVGYEHASVGHL